MKFLKSKLAFTLIELLVVITIIAVLASIALPVFTTVQIKGAQTKALSNAKQIALALRLYASDNGGIYPSYQLSSGQPTTTTVANANYAFAQLFPTYIQEERIFYVPKSAWTPTQPDEVTDNPPQDTPNNTLKAGENEWAYVLGLNDNSNPAVPLLADGFAGNTGVVTSHVYTVDQSQKGGVWKGQKAIVVCADSSGNLMTLSQGAQTLYQAIGPNGGGSTQGDIFTTGNSANGWLGSGNVTVNPL
jgi:prepilin-type N-terminal cleavage/methylation domain-containing protein